MASTQVDRFSASVPTTVPDMVGGTVEHVASGSLPQIQDASLLREAALKSRRARKHAVAQTQPTQESSATANGGTPIGDEDTLMEDATIRTKADAEDGEILENGRTHNSGGTDTFGIDAREKTPRPLSDVSNNHVKSAIGTEEPQYVRPGLKMTARDLEEAKRLILDLLGLGVKPEYLVDCGVSPQCLAVCFYEMNLRFPLNLDRRQINLPPVYDLDKHMKDSQWREQIIRQRDRNQVATAHFPIVAPSTSGSGESSALDSTTSSDPGSPGKKGSLADTSRVVREYTSPAPSHLNDERPLDSPSNGTRAGSATSTPPAGFMSAVDSSTLEDQKRMELLARKAAMESINRKRATKPLTTSATNESRPRDVQPNQLEIQDVASAVDALLASVRMDSVSSGQSEDISSKDGDRTSTGSGELLPDYDSDAMVEDELEARSPSFSDEPDDKTTDPALLLGRQRNLSPEHISPEASASTPSPRPASRVRFEAPGPARSSSLPVQPVPIAVPVVARKSRPIASDFIDQTPPRPASAFRNELERAAPLKRKRSFVDPSVWPKRLVIDLDSSDEEGEDEDEASAHPGTSNTSAPSSKTNTDRPPSRNGSHEKPGNDGRDVAAQMLLEKELQIKAMMQRIKMREMQKKKSASGTGTPVLPPANAVSTASAGENNKTAGPASTAVSIASSPKVLTANTTPLPTPRFELPLEFVPGADAQQASTISDEGMTAHKVDKGKGKTTEFEEDSTQGSKDLTKNIPAVTTADGKVELEHPLNLESEKQAPTHFKAYTSPLIGFTSPSLQRSGPTDHQLPTMYWISSTAGQRQDTDRQLCQYEFPSGICKDQGCKDIHMRDFGASDDEIWKTATSMFPNAGPVGLNEIVARVRQSVQAQS